MNDHAAIFRAGPVAGLVMLAMGAGAGALATVFEPALAASVTFGLIGIVSVVRWFFVEASWRTRLLVIGVPLGVATVWAIVCAARVPSITKRVEAGDERRRRVVDISREAARSMLAPDWKALPDLADACAKAARPDVVAFDELRDAASVEDKMYADATSQPVYPLKTALRYAFSAQIWWTAAGGYVYREELPLRTRAVGREIWNALFRLQSTDYWESDAWTRGDVGGDGASVGIVSVREVIAPTDDEPGALAAVVRIVTLPSAAAVCEGVVRISGGTLYRSNEPHMSTLYESGRIDAHAQRWRCLVLEAIGLNANAPCS